MQRVFFLLLFALISVAVNSQTSLGMAHRTTIYSSFRPAEIVMADGRHIREPQANIFMKNGALIFRRGSISLKAKMSDIVSADFGDDHYIKVDSLLAQVLDTVGQAKLIAVQLIDIDSYRSNVINARKITNIDLGEQISTTALDDPETENAFPVVCHYYYLIDGKTFRCHERVIKKMLDKEQFRRVRTFMDMPDFTWGSRDYLVRILKIIQEE